MSYILSCVGNTTKGLLWVLIGQPIFHLYLHGPSWAGGWKSRSASDICAHLTNVDATFWINNPIECDALIFRDFNSMYSFVQFILYAYLCAQCFQILMLRYVIFRPMFQTLKNLQYKKLTLDPLVTTIETT